MKQERWPPIDYVLKKKSLEIQSNKNKDKRKQKEYKFLIDGIKP
jgi:hypothetical protein